MCCKVLIGINEYYEISLGMIKPADKLSACLVTKTSESPERQAAQKLEVSFYIGHIGNEQNYVHT